MNTSETLLNINSSASSATPTPSRAKLVLMASAGMVVFGGLMLTVWGWADWSGFFAHQARCAVVALMVLRFAQAMFSLDPGIIRRGRDANRVPERGFFTLLYASLLVVMASPYFDARGLWFARQARITAVGVGWDAHSTAFFASNADSSCITEEVLTLLVARRLRRETPGPCGSRAGF